jgi:hypothetical protein
MLVGYQRNAFLLAAKVTSSTPRCFDGAGGHLVDPRLTARGMMPSIAFQLN